MIVFSSGKKYEFLRTGQIFTWRNGKKFEIKGSTHENGYKSFLFNRKKVYWHRMIAQLFVSNPKNKPCVNHKDGNKINNNSQNLEWVTYSENHIHAYRILKRKTPLGKNLGGGVCYDKRRKNWMTYLGSKENRKYFGRFKTKAEAWKKIKQIRATQ